MNRHPKIHTAYRSALVGAFLALLVSCSAQWDASQIQSARGNRTLDANSTKAVDVGNPSTSNPSKPKQKDSARQEVELERSLAVDLVASSFEEISEVRLNIKEIHLVSSDASSGALTRFQSAAKANSVFVLRPNQRQSIDFEIPAEFTLGKTSLELIVESSQPGQVLVGTQTFAMTSDATVLRFSLSEVAGWSQSQMALSTTISKNDLFEPSLGQASVITAPSSVDKSTNTSPQPPPQLPPQPPEYKLKTTK